MIILHVTNSLGVGGAEWILFRLACFQVQQGHEVHVINLGPEQMYSDKLRDEGINVIHLLRLRRHHRNNPQNIVSLLLKWPELVWKIRKINPTIVQTWMYLADLYGGVAARLLGKPVIWGIFTGRTDSSMYSSATLALLWICVPMSYWVPQAVISCSAFGRRTHIALGYQKKKVRFVPTGFSRVCALPEDRCSSQKTGEGSARGSQPLILGMLSRVSREKRHDRLIKALSSVNSKGYKVHLVLAGGVGLDAESSPLQGLIHHHNLDSQIELLGCVDNLDLFFSRIDCFVLASDSEGFPTVVGQAMAQGLPCIVSDVGDSSILLADRQQLFADNDELLLASKIIDRVTASSKETEQVGRRNKIRLEKLFSENVMLRRYNDIYSSILDSHHKR